MEDMARRPKATRPPRVRRIARLLHALGEPAAEAVKHGRGLAGRVADGPRGERLAILEHRERVDGGGDRGREAWVLRIVLGWSDRDAARAMDCSRSALSGHLASLGGRFDGQDVEALRHAMAAVDGEGASVEAVGRGRLLRLPAPWRWSIAVVTAILVIDILLRVLESQAS